MQKIFFTITAYLLSIPAYSCFATDFQKECGKDQTLVQCGADVFDELKQSTEADVDLLAVSIEDSTWSPGEKYIVVTFRANSETLHVPAGRTSRNWYSISVEKEHTYLSINYCDVF